MKLFRLPLLTTILCAFLLLNRGMLAHAQSAITLTATPEPTYTFGETLTFQISAQSNARIKTVNLFYRSAPGAETNLGKPRFIPGALITATYSISLTLNPLPAYTTVEYWWEIEDTANHTLITEPQTLLYADNRFEWRTLARDALTVHWYEGDTAFGQAAADVAFTALGKINGDLQAPLPNAIDIYIYASQAAAQDAFKSTGRAWLGGHADPALGVVIVVVSPDALEADINLGILIPHELTHVLVYRVVGEKYASVPIWLNEGLAVINQAQPNPSFLQALNQARQDQMLALADLCASFPTDPARAELAYAQSESVVRYIRDTSGISGLQTLLAAYADGLGCDAGVEKTLGISLAVLERQWLQTKFDTNPTPILLAPLLPWLALAVLIFFSGGVFALLTLRAARQGSAGQ